jgi:hypothetical protein
MGGTLLFPGGSRLEVASGLATRFADRSGTFGMEQG